MADCKALSAFDLTLDKVGNPARIEETKGEPGQPTITEATAFSYDAANRLTSECFGAQSCAGTVAERTDYTYDLVGNRTTMTRTAPNDNTKTTYAYDSADQLTKEDVTGTRSNTRAFAYDLEGNQIEAGADRFTYALDHTMTSATVGGKSTTYSYDATGNRIAAVTGAGAEAITQTWSWDVNAARPLLAQERQTDASGTTGRNYLYDPSGQPLALLVPTGDQLAAHSYLRDWLGGVAGVVSPSGAPQWSYDYDAFGVDRGTEKVDADAPANPLQYAGTYQDVSQGDRYAMGARSYDPSTGRFASSDPVTQPATDQAVSTYSYTNARPTAFTDPSGENHDGTTGNTGTTIPLVDAYRVCGINLGACATNADGNIPAGGDGQIIENPDWLASKKAVDEAESFISQIGDEIVNLILDLVGFNDAKACVTEGDIVACISTALQAVPWGKMFKAAKVAIKAIGVGRRLVEAYGRLKAARSALAKVIRNGGSRVARRLSMPGCSPCRYRRSVISFGGRGRESSWSGWISFDDIRMNGSPRNSPHRTGPARAWCAAVVTLHELPTPRPDRPTVWCAHERNTPGCTRDPRHGTGRRSGTKYASPTNGQPAQP